MFEVGDKIIYNENGVCTVADVGPIEMGSGDRLYYTLSPMVGTGTFYAPVDSKVYMRSVMTKTEAETFIDSIPRIEPAVCHDVRFTHVDAFYKEMFRKHTCEALVALLKGIYGQERANRSNRIDTVTKRAKEILNGELSVATGIPYEKIEDYIQSRLEDDKS
ncbi:MAG TPA: CarD family transcriptional regulator [Oscillospiraceae bacterium]|nr:CarD family transcriptional regulator [Oscillospiraceae bacterium]HNY00520.1 CarD family transcriptional regulator [Oscillospiraceae bacterium]HPS75958.1 CarD family transcriptional regulator [Oscillospiraceae bacterium]